MKRNFERGDAHAIVIVCLVIALIGALGWIFWQNVMKSNDRTDQSVSQNEENTKRNADVDEPTDEKTNIPDGQVATDKEKPSADEGYFAVSDWGVQFKYASGAFVKYRLVSREGVPVLTFNTRAVENLGGKCAKWGGSTPDGGDLVGLARYKEKPKNPTVESGIPYGPYVGKVGEYHYYRLHSQFVCSAQRKDDKIVTQDTNALVDMTATIKELK